MSDLLHRFEAVKSTVAVQSLNDYLDFVGGNQSVGLTLTLMGADRAFTLAKDGEKDKPGLPHFTAQQTGRQECSAMMN